MYTEDQARQKWCPMARVQEDGNAPAANRTTKADNPGTARCLGSDCMAWRWTVRDKRDKRGFCGMAGPI